MRNGVWLFRARALAAALAFAGLAAAASGDPGGVPLAAPGDCAEPRVALGAAPQGEAALSGRGVAGEQHAAGRSAGEPGAAQEPQGGADDGFDVAGSARHHFTPSDVAAGAGGEGAVLPDAPAFARGACDAPDAGCGSLLGGAAPAGGGAGGVVESPVQPGLPPGAGGSGESR
jgi:hypothetical protein